MLASLSYLYCRGAKPNPETLISLHFQQTMSQWGTVHATVSLEPPLAPFSPPSELLQNKEAVHCRTEHLCSALLRLGHSKLYVTHSVRQLICPCSIWTLKLQTTGPCLAGTTTRTLTRASCGQISFGCCLMLIQMSSLCYSKSQVPPALLYSKP